MKKTEKEMLMESVFGKNAKRRTINARDFSRGSGDSETLTAMLKQQSEQLNEMMKESSFTQEDYEKLKKEIEQDFGVSLDESLAPAPSVKKQVMSPQDAQTLISELKEKYIGQEAFILKLSDAFRKPFMLQQNDLLFKICLCGYPSTMKMEILKDLVLKMNQSGYLNVRQINPIDLSRYESAEMETLFVQDVYAALGSGDLVVFEHLEQIQPAFLSLLQTILATSELPLKKRYLANKNQLQEAGNTLTANPVDKLSFVSKGIVVCADVPENKLRDSLGTIFMKYFDDVIETSLYTKDALVCIAEKNLNKLKEKTLQMNLVIEIDESCVDALTKTYRKETGLKGLDDETERWLKALLQLKLDQRTEEIIHLKLIVNDGVVMVHQQDDAYELLGNENDSNAALEKDVVNELNEIVGLNEIKDYVLSLKDHYRIQKMRAERGMKTSAVSMHMIFTGNPGTGKTTIARLLSRYLKAIGILSSGQLVEVTRADLVGRYVGHTAPQCEKVIESALGGVLFIDEAYSLYRGKDDSFGLEAIDALVKGMEDHRDHLLVILAGYTKEMQEFLRSNSGLKSRFPNVIEFPDYTAEELLAITKSIAKSKQYVLHTDCDVPLLTYYERVQATSAADAGNGRMARNLVEAAILKQSGRCLKDENAALDELILEDFELSEVI